MNFWYFIISIVCIFILLSDISSDIKSVAYRLYEIKKELKNIQSKLDDNK